MAEQEQDNFDDFDADVNFGEDVQGQEQDLEGPAIQQPQSQAPRPQPIRAPKRPARRPQQQQIPMTPQMAAATAAPQQQMIPQQQQAIQQAAPTPAPARYIPYEMPKRIGLLDRATGKPLIEDEDMLRVVMAQLADIKNDLEEIKSYYS